MQGSTLPFALLLTLTAAVATAGGSSTISAGSASPSSVCSKRVMTGVRSGEYLLLEATDDTVVAGPGAVEIATGPLSRGTHPVPDSVAIRGQRVRVEAMAGADSVEALVRERGAVLVPWSYAPDCRPLVWGRSSRWIEPGLRGVVEASLRPRTEWADDVPTFDVLDPFPWPYPYASRWSRRSPGPLMTADEFFAFVERLPTSDRGSDLDAYGELFSWARAHPEIADREPAGSVIRRLRSAPHEEAARRLEVAFAGTWRLRVGLGERTVERWIRTAARPESAWTPPGTDWEREGPDGFGLEVYMARTPEDLPARSGERDGLLSWGRVLVTHPPRTRGDSLVWTVWLQARLLDRAVRAEGWGREWLTPGVRRPPDALSYVPLRIVSRPDGRVTATAAEPWSAAGEPVTVELERVSDVAAMDRQPPG